jgi:hypothetical protein
MTDISSLKAALLRAEASGKTDDDSNKQALAYQLGRSIIDLLDTYATTNPNDEAKLSAYDIERVLAGLLGCIIKSCALNKVAAILVAYDIAQIVLQSAIED